MTGPLTGYTVVVTARRHGSELAASLERRGARVINTATVRIVAPQDDPVLRAATVELVRDPPQLTVVTTGTGLNGWLTAAETWGLGTRLRTALAKGRVLCRDPKAVETIRTAGLVEDRTAPGVPGVAERLGTETPAGRRIAVQLHGDMGDDDLATVRAAGAVAIPVPVYRWTVPTDLAPVRRLVDAICARRVDAVTFTSAPAVSALLAIAGDQLDDMLAAMRGEPEYGRVLTAAIGPLTAAPLAKLGVPVVRPTRPRLNALVRMVATRLPERAHRTILSTRHELELRGHIVLVNGEPRTLPPAPMAILRALCEADGKVLSRVELLRYLPRGADGHAVEMAVTRLRDGLDLRSCVRTVIKRGYRLDLA